LETTLGRQDEGTVTEVPNTLATLWNSLSQTSVSNEISGTCFIHRLSTSVVLYGNSYRTIKILFILIRFILFYQLHQLSSEIYCNP
jgi:hypothetical protein